MNVDNIHIVLNETSHPGNIGAVARAMKNMGLSRLTLVNPKIFPSSHASALAAGAEDVLENASVVDGLAEALQDCQLVIACSARLRALSWPLLNPREAAERAVEYAGTGSVAIVFGNERVGLSNEDLEFCDYQCHIPTEENYSSLNLSHAVQVCIYEIRMVRLNAPTKNTQQQKLASSEELKLLHEHLMEYLTEIDFYKLPRSGNLPHRLKRLLARVQLEEDEVSILRGIISSTQKKYSSHER